MIEEIFCLREVEEIVSVCGLDPLPSLNSSVFHCYSDEKRLGFSYISVISDEAELIDIAVRPEVRGQKLGRKLLDEAIFRATQMGASSMYLEVRASNEIAINLYKSSGFVQIGERKRYYNNGENAILMRKIIHD